MSDTASLTKQQSREVAQEAGHATQQVAQTAKDQAATVAHDARDQVSQVASQTKTQARAVADDARRQLQQQADEQATKVADSMHRISGELRALCEGRPEEASTVRQYVQEVASPLEDFASRIDSRGFDGVVQDVQRFARRRPAAFLAAAAGAGFLAGRLLRSVKDEHAEPDAQARAGEVRGTATASLSASPLDAL